VHGRVVRREPDRGRVVGDRAQPDHLRIADQHAEHPLPPGESTDALDRLGVEPGVDEPAEGLVLADHPEGGVACSRELPCRLDDLVEEGIEIELTGQRRSSGGQGVARVGTHGGQA
jgi:hypothetical protein